MIYTMYVYGEDLACDVALELNPANVFLAKFVNSAMANKSRFACQ